MKYNIEISFVKIYQYIEEDRLTGGNLHTHLRFYHTGRKRAQYVQRYKGQVQNRVSISQRSEVVANKTRIGDFETDTIVGANQKGAIR